MASSPRKSRRSPPAPGPGHRAGHRRPAGGRVIEIYGPESSGKTTLTLQSIAEMQKLGGTCAFIDAEHALDVTYARSWA
jgi:RecA/RadA recombinase